MLCLALSLHLVMPWWPSCTLSKISNHIADGITSLVDLSRIPLTMVSSPLSAQYGWTTLANWCFSGHPSRQYSFTFLVTSSSACASISCCNFMSYIGMV